MQVKNGYDIGPCRHKLADSLRDLERILTEISVREGGPKCPYNWATTVAMDHLAALEQQIQDMGIWETRPLDPADCVFSWYPLPDTVCSRDLYPEALNLWALYLAAPLTERQRARKMLDDWGNWG